MTTIRKSGIKNRGFVLIWAVVIMMIAMAMILSVNSFFTKLIVRVEPLFNDNQNFYYCQMGIYYAKAYVDTGQVPLNPGAITFAADPNNVAASTVTITIPDRNANNNYIGITATSSVGQVVFIMANFELDANNIYKITSWTEMRQN